MDYIKAGWPPKLIQDWFDLSDKQIADVLAYIEAHRDEVEVDYHFEFRSHSSLQCNAHLRGNPPDGRNGLAHAFDTIALRAIMRLQR
jgi:hypothetical protein